MAISVSFLKVMFDYAVKLIIKLPLPIMSAHREASGIDTKGTSYLEDIKLDYESNDITQRPSRGETSCPNTLANDGYVVISDGIKTHGLVSPKDSP